MLSMRTLAALTAAATALALGACGDDEETDAGGTAATATPTATETPAAMEDSGGGGEIALAADPGGALKFDKSSLSAKAGKVTVVMDNPSDLPHAVEVEGNGVEKSGETATKGGVSKVSANLKPGTYEYYCPVGNHKAAGMEGTLTVK